MARNGAFSNQLWLFMFLVSKLDSPRFKNGPALFRVVICINEFWEIWWYLNLHGSPHPEMKRNWQFHPSQIGFSPQKSEGILGRLGCRLQIIIPIKIKSGSQNYNLLHEHSNKEQQIWITDRIGYASSVISTFFNVLDVCHIIHT